MVKFLINPRPKVKVEKEEKVEKRLVERIRKILNQNQLVLVFK
jgi:hypothetical protein